MGDYTMKRERPTRFSNSYYNNFQSNQYQHDSTKESKDSKNSSSKAVMSENEVSRAYLDTIKRLEDEIQKNDNEIKHLEDFNILAYDKIQLLTNELQQIKEENNALSNDLLDMYDYCDNQESYIKELQLKNKQLTRENEHLLNENEELRMQHIHNKWLSSSQQREKQQRRRNRSSTSDIVEEKSPSSSIFAPASLLFPNDDDEDDEEEETFVVDSKVLELQLYIEKQQKAAAIAKKQVEEKLKQQEEVIKCTQSCLDVERRKSKSLSQRLLTLQQDNNVSEEQQVLDGTDENSNRVQCNNNSNPWRRLSSITQKNKRLFSISHNYDSSSNNRRHHNEEEEDEDGEPRLTLMSDPLSNKEQGFPLSRRRINNSKMLYYQDYKDEGSNSSSIQSIQKNVNGEGDRRRDTNDSYNTVSTLSPNNRMRRFPNVLSMLRGGGAGIQPGNNHERFSATTLSNDGILMKQNSDSSNISTVTDVTTTKEHNSMVSNCALSATTTIVVPSSKETLKEEEEEEPKYYKNNNTTTRLTPAEVKRRNNVVGERRQSSLQKTSNNEKKTALTERCILSSSAA